MVEGADGWKVIRLWAGQTIRPEKTHEVAYGPASANNIASGVTSGKASQSHNIVSNSVARAVGI